MLRMMPRLFLIALLLCSLLLPVQADILWGRKDGDIIECKVTGMINKKIPGQGGPKDFWIAELEDGTKKEYLVRDYQLLKRKPSWEARAEAKEWYAKEAPNVPNTWKKQERFAKRCRNGFKKFMKGHLDEEAMKHFQEAYKLHKPDLGEDMGKHRAMARKLENDWGLFDEALEEWRWVYRKKKAETDEEDAQDHYALATWCMREGLYDEALLEYKRALELNPNYSQAKLGLDKLKKALEIPVNQQMYRVVKAPMARAWSQLIRKQNKDGSFGSDFREAGVHGHHGMSALSGLALLAHWEFQILEDLNKAQSPPKELLHLLQFVLLNHETGKGLRGPDVWGAIWRLEFLARCYKKSGLASKKKAIEARILESIEELKGYTRPDGGWSYYDFVKTGTTFVTASGVVALADVKDAKLRVDPNMISRAADMIFGQARQSEGQYTYKPGGGEAPVGCAGRSSLCELALLRAGKPANGLAKAMDNFFRHRHLLEAIKQKQGTHIGEGKTAPYYFLFGHYWTTRAIKFLPGGMQTVYRKKMKEAFLKPDNQEKDGTYWDTPLTKDKDVYGTAFGIMTLYQLALEQRRKL